MNFSDVRIVVVRARHLYGDLQPVGTELQMNSNDARLMWSIGVCDIPIQKGNDDHSWQLILHAEMKRNDNRVKEIKRIAKELRSV